MQSRDFREHLNHLMIIESFFGAGSLTRSVQMEQFAIYDQSDSFVEAFLHFYLCFKFCLERMMQKFNKKYIFYYYRILKKDEVKCRSGTSEYVTDFY